MKAPMLSMLLTVTSCGLLAPTPPHGSHALKTPSVESHGELTHASDQAGAAGRASRPDYCNDPFYKWNVACESAR